MVTRPWRYQAVFSKVFQLRDLSRRHRQRLDLALRVSLESSVGHRHGAVVVRGGCVLATASNSVSGEHSTHAEVAALRQVKDASGCILYVARTNRQGLPRYSRPCEQCLRLARTLGVRLTIYTPGIMEFL